MKVGMNESKAGRPKKWPKLLNLPYLSCIFYISSFDVLYVFQVGKNSLTAQIQVHGRQKLDFWVRPMSESQLCILLTMRTGTNFLVS